MKKDPLVFIEHILESIDSIKEYIEGLSKEDFFSSKEKQDAILRRIEIIGEAVKNLPEDVKSKHSEVPWKKITGMRDIVVHNYFGVDLNLTWKIATTDIDELKTTLLKVKKSIKR
jgi:uncharacterized protein with HEPN domain